MIVSPKVLRNQSIPVHKVTFITAPPKDSAISIFCIFSVDNIYI